jgi:class 3 adenylate cyclase
MTACPPSGVVTFLFTYIEGSTRRWEADADAMRSALLAHDKVLRSAIETHGEEPGWREASAAVARRHESSHKGVLRSTGPVAHAAGVIPRRCEPRWGA